MIYILHFMLGALIFYIISIYDRGIVGQIVVVERGRVVEEGTHTELMVIIITIIHIGVRTSLRLSLFMYKKVIILYSKK